MVIDVTMKTGIEELRKKSKKKKINFRKILSELDSAEAHLSVCKKELSKNRLDCGVIETKCNSASRYIIEVRKEVLNELYLKGGL